MSSTSTPAPNETIAQLEELMGIENTHELAATYLKEYDGLFRTLVSGPREEQHRAAHSLKSSSRHMGLTPLVQKFAALEAQLLQPDGSVDGKDIMSIMETFEKLIPPLRKYAKAKQG